MQIIAHKSYFYTIPVFICTALTCSLFANEPMTVAELQAAAKSPGEFKSLTSKKSDPVAKEGSWGFTTTFIINNSVAETYAVMIDVEKLPERLEKVKRLKVLERKPNGVITKHTEKTMGIESTMTMEYVFDPARHTIISQTIGKEDKAVWNRIAIKSVGHPDYCRMTITVFADVSWLPDFVLNWGLSRAANETADTMREMVTSAYPGK